jgi:hypothetical protein
VGEAEKLSEKLERSRNEDQVEVSVQKIGRKLG